MLVRSNGMRKFTLIWFCQMLSMFAKVFHGTHVRLGCVGIHQVRSFAIETGAGDVLNIDGELKSTTPARVEVVPAALRVFA